MLTVASISRTAKESRRRVGTESASQAGLVLRSGSFPPEQRPERFRDVLRAALAQGHHAEDCQDDGGDGDRKKDSPKAGMHESFQLSAAASYLGVRIVSDR
jgi:hypothetical protein